MRCWRLVPARTPTTAGSPTSAAAPGLSSPWNAYVIAPARDEKRMAASEVAEARRWSKARRARRSGTITIPPPTPNSAPNVPPTAPIKRSFGPRTSLTLRRVDPLELLASEPAEAALFLDVDGVLAPIVERPEDAAVPEQTRRELARLADDYALVACVTGRT